MFIIPRLRAAYLATVTVCLFTATCGKAAVLLGNLPADDNATTALIDFGSPLSNQKAVVFLVGPQDIQVSGVTLRLLNYQTPQDVASVGFFLDNGTGNTLGSLVAGGELIAPASASNTAADFLFTPAAPLVLTANTVYWLHVDSGAIGSTFNWAQSASASSPVGNGVTFLGFEFSSNNGTGFSDSPIYNAFQIDGIVLIPEPGSACLLGAAGLLLARRRRA